MDIAEILLLILIFLGGSFVQRVSGFGMGIFAMLFLPYLLGGSSESAAVVGMVSFVGSVYNTVRNHKKIQWKTMLPLVIASLITIPIAVHFSKTLPQTVLKQMLGVVLVVLSLYFLFFSKRIRIKANMGSGLVAGTLSGVLSGLFATGGPPAVIYVLNATADNLAYFATIQAFFSITNLYSFFTRLLSGIITGQVMIWFAVSLFGLLLGNYLGGKVFSRLNAERLKQVIYIGMIISGILMIL